PPADEPVTRVAPHRPDAGRPGALRGVWVRHLSGGGGHAPPRGTLTFLRRMRAMKQQQKPAQGQGKIRPTAAFIDSPPGDGKAIPACDLAPDGTYSAPDTGITAVYLSPLPTGSGKNIYASVKDDKQGDWSATFN